MTHDPVSTAQYLDRQSTTSPLAKTASTPSTEPCRLPYLGRRGGGQARKYCRAYLRSRRPPALVLTFPPMWQLPYRGEVRWTRTRKARRTRARRTWSTRERRTSRTRWRGLE